MNFKEFVHTNFVFVHKTSNLFVQICEGFQHVTVCCEWPVLYNLCSNLVSIKSTIRGTFLVGEVLSSITLSLFEIFQPNLVNLYYLRYFFKLC